jgi:hypothetical protein
MLKILELCGSWVPLATAGRGGWLPCAHEDATLLTGLTGTLFFSPIQQLKISTLNTVLLLTSKYRDRLLDGNLNSWLI